jgi:alpha-L-fucosidase
MIPNPTITNARMPMALCLLLVWIAVLSTHTYSASPVPDSVVNDSAAARLARPSVNQYAWHEQERTLFVCIGVATWEGTEYDADGKTDLKQINPDKFDANQLCAAAQSFGAKQILLVCKHVGGFCLWPTATTPYHIGNTPWKNGKGNMVKEVADACRRHGLKMGVYLYPDDTRYAGGIGRSGRTDDPAKQQEWNQLFIKQWEEVLTLCGPDLVNEIWLDGGCVIDIDPTIKRLAPKAVLFGGKQREVLRWVGNEQGIAPDANWNSLNQSDITKGDGAAGASNPDGDLWAPMECDTTLYDHNWFWNSGNEAKRKSLDHLMNIYVKSAGNGSLLLLNATPNTTGAIPAGDMQRYAEFGAAIDKNFGHPVGMTRAPVTGATAECDLAGPKTINCADLWEDYQLGHRIRAYVIEGRVDGRWAKLGEGTAVGRRKLLFFPTITVDRLRVRVTKSVGTPVIRLLQAHQVDESLVGALRLPISQGCPAKASTSHSAPYAPEFLVDGYSQSRWGTTDGDKDPWVELDLGRPRKFANASLSELADRVKKFRIEYRNDSNEDWKTAHEGTTVGGSWNADFDRVTARFVRVHVLEYDGPGVTFWEWKLFDRADAFETVGRWLADKGSSIDLSLAINEAAWYELKLVDSNNKPVRVKSAKLFFDGSPAEPACLGGVGTDTLRINRTQAIGPGASSKLFVIPSAKAPDHGKILLRPVP